jgi:hypothetical protein
VRETERRAKGREDGGDRERSGPVELHPDLADALAAAEDALQAALGVEVKVRQHGSGCRAEIALESPSDGIELAERLLRRDPPAEARAA